MIKVDYRFERQMAKKGFGTECARLAAAEPNTTAWITKGGPVLLEAYPCTVTVWQLRDVSLDCRSKFGRGPVIVKTSSRGCLAG